MDEFHTAIMQKKEREALYKKRQSKDNNFIRKNPTKT